MAGTYDNEKQRTIDRIKCIAFREARDAGATFINKKWIAQKLGRSERWVQDTWNKSSEECFTEFGDGRPLVLSQESRRIVENSSNMQKKSCYQVKLHEKFWRTEIRKLIEELCATIDLGLD